MYADDCRSDRHTGNTTTEPFHQPEPSKVPDDATKKQSKKAKTKDKATKASKRELLEGRRKKRAEDWKKAHPEVSDAPSIMSHGDVRKLNEKLATGSKKSIKTQKDKVDKSETQKRHTTEFKKRYPHVPNVPKKITVEQMRALCEEHGIKSKGLWKKLL